MIISLIVAMDQNRLIGKAGKLPWKISEDLAWFKHQTLGHPVIMGRNTWLSLDKALPGRKNIVLSRTGLLQAPGAELAADIPSALAICHGIDAFVIGGAQVFAQFMPIANRLVITHIEASFEGDTYFPPYPEKLWQLESCEELLSSQGIRLEFATYTKRS